MSVVLQNESTALVANETIKQTINHSMVEDVLTTINQSVNQLIPDHSTARISLAITIAIIAATTVLIAYYFMFGSPKRRHAVLIAGPQKAGKTVLLYQLLQGAVRETVTSMQPNDATFVPFGSSGQPVRFIDTPGHPSQRFQLLSSFPMLKSCLFLINPSHLNGSNITSTASLLYEVLSHPLLQQRKVPIMIVCNTAAGQSNDQVMNESQMQQALERALDSKRKLISSMPDLGGDAEELTQSQRKLGNVSDEANFTFADSPLRITCKVWSGQMKDLNVITNWLVQQK